MVVIIQTGLLQIFRHAVFQQAERAAGFQAERFHRAHHLADQGDIGRLRPAPCRAHAEAAGTARLGDFGFFHYFRYIQHFRFFYARVVMRRLWAIFAILRTAAGFNRQQGGQLDFLRIEILTVHAGGLEHQVQKGQVEQFFHLAFAPIGGGGVRLGIRHGLPQGNRGYVRHLVILCRLEKRLTVIQAGNGG